MPRIFRIHGDNIVECERIANLIFEETAPTSVEISLMSPSTIVYNLQFHYLGHHFAWRLELLPGFNKAGRSRWEGNIFAGLKESGSFLDETPDAIVTYLENGFETILYAIEFCSALQAGNQAWQRSGRAFSTGRTGCPYIYVVDFVNYELDSKTRERKSLRFPNPAVPYSYINFSENAENFVALDVPVLTRNSASAYDAEVLLDTSELKRRYIGQVPDEDKLTQDAFSSIPQSFHEDDVDTGIHFLFSHLLHEVCFEGMCNPPGGDWSGLSVLYGDSEVRWLSLPRESKAIDGKRPDHVLELFGVLDCPVLLSIESKERSMNLETNVGKGLINYIYNLMRYIPSVERSIHPRPGAWTRSNRLVDFNAFEVISAAAYLRGSAQANRTVFERSGCDMLFMPDSLRFAVLSIELCMLPIMQLDCF